MKLGLVHIIVSLFLGFVFAQAIGAEQTLDRPTTNTPDSKAEIVEIFVEVAGEVNEPGVYRQRFGDRVWDVLDNAGGITENADLSNLNLAAVLLDATRVYVPTAPWANVEKQERSVTLSNTSKNPDQHLNPPQYTKTGWIWLSVTGQLQREKKPETKPNGASDAAKSAGGLIDLNKATKSELETLPGIGPATADKIIKHREVEPFRQVDDLQKVSGIGPSKFNAVKDLVAVQ